MTIPKPVKEGQKPALDYIFHPETIAVAGVSNDTKGIGIANSYIKRFEAAGFKGNIYAVNPSGGEALGRKIYPSLKDIPEHIDFVVSAIPARHTPQLISDCAEKGVKLLHLFTAGFSELGNEEGKALESEILSIAQQSGIRMTGPNGMGIYCPKTGLTFDEGFTRKSGNVGWIAQSGRNGTYVVRDASMRGVYFSKAISYGNAADLNECDFIEYFRDDPDTEIIAAYIEGVKDGKKFFKVLKEAASVKPVVIFKAGNTEAGSRGAASHTASIAGSSIVWSAALKQAGAVQVHSLEELVDMLLLFNFLSPPTGRNISIVGFGGGAGIQASDACTDQGMTVPLSPQELQDKLAEICGGQAGSIFKNPFDLWPKAGSKGTSAAIESISGWEKTDLLLVHIQFDLNPSIRNMMYRPYLETLKRLAPDIKQKTVVVLDFVLSAEAKKLSLEVQSVLAEEGFAVFPSVYRAALALGRYINFHDKK
ncbi:MAG: CoA-binding protein [Dehalococcoidales bacterium]|nr:MAG: CoA-binding protein [Dehalococcoidales bacterium]